MNRTIQTIAIAVVGLLVGCQSRNSTNSPPLEEAAALASTASSVAVAVPASGVSMAIATPLYGASLALEGGNRAVQGGSIALGMADPAFAHRISRDDLLAVARNHGWKFYEPWFYMGTRNHRHYFALYPFGGRRQIYSVPEDEWNMDDPFPLTAFSSAWREIQMPRIPMQGIPIVSHGRMMPNLRLLESEEPIRFFILDRDPFTFFEQHGQQINVGNAEKPAGVEPTQ